MIKSELAACSAFVHAGHTDTLPYTTQYHQHTTDLICWVQKVKYLGAFVTSKLNWLDHCKDCVCKSQSSLSYYDWCFIFSKEHCI